MTSTIGLVFLQSDVHQKCRLSRYAMYASPGLVEGSKFQSRMRTSPIGINAVVED